MSELVEFVVYYGVGTIRTNESGSVDLSSFQQTRLSMQDLDRYPIEAIKEWFTRAFGLDPEVASVIVQAYFSKSCKHIRWDLFPLDLSKDWRAWLRASKARKGYHYLLVQAVPKKVSSEEAGDGDNGVGQNITAAEQVVSEEDTVVKAGGPSAEPSAPGAIKYLSGSVDEGEIRRDTVLKMSSTVPKSPNIFWHDCPVGKTDREKLLKQKGCVVWITGLSGSGKSTLACTLGRELHTRGKLAYVLDGDNLRHGLNRDLGFKAEDRAENIRRVDAGLVCIASFISPYWRDRESCRALLSDGSFIEVFLNMSLELCETRDPKGLYKLARAGKIKGFTGIDDPYEPPLNCEIEIKEVDGVCPSPSDMTEQVVTYLEAKGLLHE